MTWSIVSNLLCHTVDYCAIALLRRLLPVADKRVHLLVSKVEQEWLRTLPGIPPPESLCVIHAGRHWPSKTFPVAWWQAVADGIAANGIAVCLIGQDADGPEDARGVQPIICPHGGVDLRNRLSLNQLIALLAQAPVLLSNDSAPIHLAGAADNHIILIPSCKHPEHVLPYRHGSVWWNAQALYQRLTLDDVSSQPTELRGTEADAAPADWAAYLPTPQAVIAAAQEGFHGSQ
jgi:ADP-heptose:LPS heptosyltransferase